MMKGCAPCRALAARRQQSGCGMVALYFINGCHPCARRAVEGGAVYLREAILEAPEDPEDKPRLSR